MSTDHWKLEKDLCRCCHSEGSFKVLSEPHRIGGEEEIYSEMLRHTIDVDLTPVEGPLCTATYTICETCIERLRDACNFKKQVLQCEKMFKDMYRKDFIKVAASGTNIKQEAPEPDDAMDEGRFDDSDEMDYNLVKCDEPPKVEIKEEKKPKARKAKPKAKKKKVVRSKKIKTEAGEPEEGGDGEPAEKKDSYVPQEDMTDYTIVEDGSRKKYSCNKCGALLTTVHTMRSHIKGTHFNISTFECPLCDEKFKTRGTRSRHLALKHGMDEVIVGGMKVLRKSKKHICKICNKEFPNRIRYITHIQLHKLQKCPHCSLMFTRDEIAFHRSEVHGDNIPTCGVCGYKSSQQWRVVTHQRKVHLKEKNLSCSYCEMKFFDAQQLRKHLVKHNPVKIHECPYCKKKFPRSGALKQHVMIHTGDKRKICTICDERFVQKASLNYHMAKYHPDAN